MIGLGITVSDVQTGDFVGRIEETGRKLLLRFTKGHEGLLGLLHLSMISEAPAIKPMGCRLMI